MLKFGLSVTGYAHPKKIWSNAGAQPGDLLILTKRLGTGTCMAALKQGRATEPDLSEVLQSMTQLNNVVDRLLPEEISSVHAATDITGFGLVGHSMQMAMASHCTIEFNFDRLPFFSRAVEFL